MNPSSPLDSIRTPFRVHVVQDRAQAERAVAREIAELVRSRAANGQRTVLGLATGRTQQGVYAELVRLQREEGYRYATVVGFNLDEYVGLKSSDPRSFRHYMEQHFYVHVDVPADAIHVPDGELARVDVAAYCAHYERAIREAGGIDLQLLGVGRNGHIGFNEPGSARESRTRMVELDEVTRRDAAPYFEGHGEVPRHALTMGVATILEARRVRALAFGERKAHAVEQAFTGAPSPGMPASFLRGHADLELWLDAAAAAGLEPEAR